MKRTSSLLDTGSFVTLVITLLLFVVALFENGLTHDLLLEAGVFLVSVKLVIMSYKNGLTSQSIHQQLDDILVTVRRSEGSHDNETDQQAVR